MDGAPESNQLTEQRKCAGEPLRGVNLVELSMQRLKALAEKWAWYRNCQPPAAKQFAEKLEIRIRARL
jgi:hypothetical protein